MTKVAGWQSKIRSWLDPSRWMIRFLKLEQTEPPAAGKGLILIQIDGLSHALLQKAFTQGKMPFLKKLMHEESYQLGRHYPGIPSSTPSIQGELFYGVRQAFPAFKYRDGCSGKIFTFYSGDAARETEARLGRRGANMGVLRCDHPDIVEFIRAKQKSQRFANFNLSVGITDAFMRACVHRREYPLINPRTQRECGRLKARFVFSLMARCAWHSGEPGILYLDEINRRHPLVSLGTIEASNPCGELPLLPYESCNLGSVNLVKMVKDGSVNWEKLEKIISLSIRFLDNILEVNHYPSREIRAASLASRKIGLGVMGFADMLIRLGISYNSLAAVRAAERLMKFIRFCSLKASAKLARERGVFPNYASSVYRRRGLQLRNATLNAIAPTGTLSLIAGCSSGIEPLFAPRYSRRMLEGLLVRETLESKSGPHACARCSGIAPGLYSGAQGEQPSQRSFIRTALEIPPAQHLKIQAAFQRHTDNAVSKTINLKAGSTPKDIEKIFTAAYRLKCKGITVYRYGSRKDQVLNLD